MFRFVLASAASVAFFAAPAAAQNYAAAPAVYFSASKTQAILGGESRLASILAQQSGQKLPQPQPSMVSPAGYGVPVRNAAMPLYRPAISMDRPDVFNSVALPISRTSLDRRWRKVANGPVGAASAAYANELSGRSATEKLEAVPSAGEISRVAERQGMVRLRDDGLLKAAQGTTTIEEALKTL